MNSFKIEKILNETGIVIRCPVKFKERLYVIEYIAGKFEAGRVYTEKEINAVIKEWIEFSDYVLIRRELVDFGFLSRTRNGGEYRRADELPNVEEILERF